MSFFEFGKCDKILLLGEGNFSFSRSLLEHMKEKCGISNYSNFYATCFQNDLSPLATMNVNFLRNQGAEVLLGVDATKLEDEKSLEFIQFKKIIFNFPHVGGKMKIHLNRALLCNFFMSCFDKLTIDGRVIVTLCSGQGGTGFETPLRRWDDTWKIVEQAAHGGFLLSQVEYFPHSLFDGYEPVGYRGREQRFSIKSSVVHIFCKSVLPTKHISSDMISDVTNYHAVETIDDLTMSYAHKLAFLKNPLKNQKSPQHFLVTKLYDFVKKYVMETSIDLHIPYHTDYDIKKAPCFYKGSLYSLRSSLVEVMPQFHDNFVIEGLVFQKFGSDFSKIGVCCEAVVGGSFKYAVIKDFFSFITKVFNFDGNIVIEENINELNVYIECDMIPRIKVVHDNFSLNCITIDIDQICLFFLKVSRKQLWAKGIELNDTSFRLIFPSLYPQKFSFDVSFTAKYFDEDEFFNLLHQIPDSLINSVKLLSVYQPADSFEKSYCYRLDYKSFEKPLYRQLVIDIHHNIVRTLLENILHVTVH